MRAAPQVVLIEWVDSTQPEPSWRHLENAPSLTTVSCRSVGWLIAESDDVLMIAPNVGDLGTESAQASGFLRIPKAAITRRVHFYEDALFAGNAAITKGRS